MFATIIFCLFMLVALWSTMLIICRLVAKNDYSWHIIVAAASWTGVVTHLMHIW